MKPVQKIIIAGGGFGGVRTALRLANSKHFDVTLIADRATFRYYPALYATATGHSYEESIIPISDMILGFPQITFVKDKVLTLDAAGKRIRGESGTWYTYDSLVLALGMVTNYFGIDGLDKFSFGIKDEQEIEQLRRHVHADMDDDKKSGPNYVVVGAGPTGVELASSLKSYVQHVAYCHQADSSETSFKLVEAMPRVLPKLPERASRLVTKRLLRLGVEVMTSSKVEGETIGELTVNGQSIKTHTVIWTSGVSNNPFFTANAKHFKLAANHKAQVDAFLQGLPNVYIIGDNAQTPHSGLAQTALYDANFISRNLKRQARGQKPKAYKPYAPPMVIPVGKRWSLFVWGPLVFAGWPGAILRRFADLIGYLDLLPVKKAFKLWLAADHLEEDCPVCRMAPVAKKPAA